MKRETVIIMIGQATRALVSVIEKNEWIRQVALKSKMNVETDCG